MGRMATPISIRPRFQMHPSAAAYEYDLLRSSYEWRMNLVDRRQYSSMNNSAVTGSNNI